jgi:predicted acetyltransferase
VTTNYLTLPVDPASASNLAEHGLRFAVLDTSDTAAFESWLQAVNRGFHEAWLTQEGLDVRVAGTGDRRTSGVWDDGGADPATPVATVSSWVADLTVPGRRAVPAWAISNVSVAPTHRRRGVARNLLEAELRTAAALGVPVAILTASEATIYGRFGFAPSAMVASWRIDTRRAKWIGPTVPGRVQLVPTELVRDRGGHELLESVRLSVPGQMRFDGMLWERLFGMAATDEGKEIRVVRYDDAAGTPRGFAAYRVEEAEDDLVLELKYLIAATDDAYAALWRYLLEVDLVTTVTAKLRPVDEPVQWQIADARAAAKTAEGDHLWSRILDVKAVLEARVYGAPGRIVLDVADPLGFAAGRYLLDIAADGTAAVTSIDEPLADVPALALGVNELGAVYLGGVSFSTLVRAGRIRELRPGSAVAADASFHSTVAPWLSIWF